MIMIKWTILPFLIGAVIGQAEERCPRGSYLVFGECHLCPKGSYQQDEGRNYCTRCPRGSYADVRGSIQCKSCPENHLTYFDSSESLEDCVGPKLLVTSGEGGAVFEYSSEVTLKLEVPGYSVVVKSGRWRITTHSGQQFELREEASLPEPIRPRDLVRATPLLTNEFCYTGTGHEYEGVASVTEYMVECLYWDTVASVTNYNPGHNYCRSIGKYSKRPYCFIPGDVEPRAVPCAVPKCVWDVECTSTPNGEHYQGPKDRTISGYKCQNWRKDYPHPHSYNDVGDHNQCRNPGGEEGTPWCYTMALTFPIWDYCSVRECVEGKDKKYNYSRD